MLERAQGYYLTAVERYPTSTELRLQLAAVAAFAGDENTYRTELREARRLSELTPHDDKKLENQLIWLPLREIPASLRVAGEREVRAEPLMAWLRSQEAGFFDPGRAPATQNAPR